MEEFFYMGGYARFIWPAYLIVALIMTGLWIASSRFQQTSANKLKVLHSKSQRGRNKRSDEA